MTQALRGNDLVVVPKKDVNEAIDGLEDISAFSEADAKKLGKAVEADAVVHGMLTDKKGSKTLKLELFVNGKKEKGFSITFKNAKAAKFRRALHDTMLKKIKSAMPADSADEEEPTEDEEAGATKMAKKPKKGAKTAAADDEAEKPKCKKGKKCKVEKTDASEEDEPVKETKKKLKDGDDEENPLPAAKSDKKKKGDEAAKEEDKPAKEEGSDDEERKAAKKETAKKDEGDEGEEKEASTTARAAPAAGPARTANRAAARLDAGASFDNRQLVFKSNLPSDQAPKNFKSSPVPGARFDVDLFPMAIGNPKGILAGIGVAVEYDKTIGEKIRNDVGASAINQQHYLIAGQYRMVIGKKATSPSVTVGFGYGRRTFQIVNRTGLMDPDPPPDTDYKYYAPRLGLRLPVVGSIALIAEGEGMAIFNAGPIQRADQYGRAKVFGFTGLGGAEYVIGNRIAVRVIGEFNQIGFTFIGRGGDLANNRDMNPDTLDVGGAADRSIGVVGTLGVLY